MGLFNELFHDIVFSLLKILDSIMNAFYLLAGLTPVDGRSNPNATESGIPQAGVGDDVLSKLFSEVFGKGMTLTKLYIYFIAFAMVILGTCMVVGILKTLFGKKDEVGSRKLVYAKSASSVLLMVSIPLIFTIAVWFTAVFISTITTIMAIPAGGDFKISNTIIESCIEGEFSSDFVGKLTTEMEYSEFTKAFVKGKDGFNYWLCLISACCTGVGLVMVSLTIVERIIHLGYYYLVSPFVIAKMPLDEGKSFEQWKEGVLSKFLSLAGIIVLMYLFFLFNGTIQKLFTVIIPEGLSDGEKRLWTEKRNTYNVAKLLFFIGGVFCFTKGGTLTANLISSGAGQFEGMSQGTSLGMLNTGLRMAGGVAKGAVGGALLTGKNGLNMLGGAGGRASGDAMASVKEKSLTSPPSTTAGESITGKAVPPLGHKNLERGGIANNVAIKNRASAGEAFIQGGVGAVIGFTGAKAIGGLAKLTGLNNVAKKIGSGIGSGIGAVKNGEANVVNSFKSKLPIVGDKAKANKEGKAQAKNEIKAPKQMQKEQSFFEKQNNKDELLQQRILSSKQKYLNKHTKGSVPEKNNQNKEDNNK